MSTHLYKVEIEYGNHEFYAGSSPENVLEWIEKNIGSDCYSEWPPKIIQVQDDLEMEMQTIVKKTATEWAREVGQGLVFQYFP